MIQLVKNQTKIIAPTLKEKQTLVTADFLFKFVHDMTGEIKLFTATDLSLFVERYNKFNIIDNPSENPYAGQIDFKKGYHSYVIYEMTPASPVDLDPDNAVGILETGKVEVLDLTASTDVSFDQDDAIDNVCFDLPD